MSQCEVTLINLHILPSANISRVFMKKPKIATCVRWSLANSSTHQIDFSSLQFDKNTTERFFINDIVNCVWHLSGYLFDLYRQLRYLAFNCLSCQHLHSKEIIFDHVINIERRSLRYGQELWSPVSRNFKYFFGLRWRSVTKNREFRRNLGKFLE